MDMRNSSCAIADFSFSDLQSLLPEGLALQNEIDHPVAKTRIFEVVDRRLSEAYPILRTLWIVDLRGESERQKNSFFERTQNFLNRSATDIRFTSPQEAQATSLEGVVYVQFPHYVTTLREVMPPNGCPRSTALPLLRQILEGLADLHRSGIVHGEVRPWCVGLSTTTLTEHSTARLVGLSSGSSLEGYRVQDEHMAVRSLPPEWEGKIRDPSQSADVYALGILACQLLFGSDSITNDTTLQKTRKRLQKSREFHWIAESLQPDSAKRPLNAQTLLELQQKNSRWRSSVLVRAVFVVCVISTGFAWSWNAASKEVLKRKDEEITHLKSGRDQFEAELKSKYDLRLNQEIEALKKVQSASAPSDSETEIKAQKTWRDLCKFDICEAPDKKSIAEILATDPRRSSLEAWMRIWNTELSKGDWVRQELLKTANSVLTKDFAQEKERKVLQDFLSSPWEETKKEAWRSVKEDYLASAVAWREAAIPDNRPVTSWDDFKMQLDDAANENATRPRVREILTRWRKAFEARKKWKLRILDAHTPNASDNYRLIEVYRNTAGGSFTEGWISVGSQDEQWSSTSDRNGLGNLDIDVDWEPGYAIRLCLWGSRFAVYGGQRSRLLDRSIDHPISLWNLRDPTTIEDNGPNSSLKIQVLDCPGPPLMPEKPIDLEKVLSPLPSPPEAL